jgi:hypothetical protein
VALAQGEPIVVQRCGFGTRHEPDGYDYFDECSSDWSCDRADESCTDPPATTGIA